MCSVTYPGSSNLHVVPRGQVRLGIEILTRKNSSQSFTKGEITDLVM